VCQSVAGLGGVQAWRWRERAALVAPAAALSSLAQLSDERSWSWRREWLARAPRPVLRSLDGLDEERAHDLRERALERAPEAVSSLYGLDSPRAHALREAAATRWPVAVAKSLAGPLAHTSRGQALLCRLLGLHPAHVGLWKHAGAAALPTVLPAPLRQVSHA
jgi:dTMP kinase